MKQNISELICTRLSHDIIGNIGAVANAVELLEEGDADFMDDIKSILKTSSNVLSARMKFFRLAFGLNNANLKKQDILQEAARGYLATIGSRNHPISLAWNDIPEAYTRLALLGVMSIADILVRGGTISVRPYQQGIAVTHNEDAQISAEKVTVLKNVINSGNTEDNAQLAPIAYLVSLVRESGIKFYLVSQAGLGFVFE